MSVEGLIVAQVPTCLCIWDLTRIVCTGTIIHAPEVGEILIHVDF